MPYALLIAAVALQAAQPEPIDVVARVWAPFISPMGEPFRSRAPGDDTLVYWFAQADGDGDGVLTESEMRADAERFFAMLDADRDGAILPAEIVAYEWEVAPEVQVNSQRRRARGEPAPAPDKRRRTPAAYDLHRLQGAARYTLLNIPQPVAAADADFDRAITIGEFRSAAEHRFRLLDRAGDRQLVLAELQAMVPSPSDKRRRPQKGERDARIGVPVPLED